MGRITVFSGVERRRRWDDDEKLAMVEASLVPGGGLMMGGALRMLKPALAKAPMLPRRLICQR